jgi:hypothetical protein
VRCGIELARSYGWAPTRILTARLERDGYHVTEVRGPEHIVLTLAGGPVQRGAELSLVPGGRRLLRSSGAATAGLEEQPYNTLPVLVALAPLLPGGGLANGSVVAIDRPGLLCLALLAAASQQGMWCAVAGIPGIGIAAAAEIGVKPSHLVLVPEPGRRWPDVISTLLEACPVVLAHPGCRVPVKVRRRLENAARRTGSVLLVAGEWDGALLRLRITRQSWLGMEYGCGRLRVRLAEVAAEGRGTLAQPRKTWLWLPGPDGTVTAASEPPADFGTIGTAEDGCRRHVGWLP